MPVPNPRIPANESFVRAYFADCTVSTSTTDPNDLLVTIGNALYAGAIAIPWKDLEKLSDEALMEVAKRKCREVLERMPGIRKR